MKTIVKVVIGVGIAVGLVAAGGGWYALGHRAGNQPKTTTVERGNVQAEVSFAARLEPVDEVAVGFEGGGTVSLVAVAIGDTVKAGQVLARADSRSQQLEAAQATTIRQLTEQEYQLLAGKAAHEAGNLAAENKQTIGARQQAVRDAKIQLDQAQEIWQQTVRESGDESSTAKAKLLAVQTATATYHAAQDALKATTTTTIKTNSSAVDAAGVAQAQLRLQEQTYTEQLAKVRLAKSTLVAPLAGVVTARNIEPGGLALAGQTAITIATTAKLELKAHITETDATKITVGQPASFTLDVYPDQATIIAQVSHLDPAAKIIDGVPIYEITLAIINPEPAWRPGLTANVTIATAQREQVLTISRRAIIRHGSEQFVKIPSGSGQITEQPITTGLIGSDGRVEVVSGLAAGATVIVPSL